MNIQIENKITIEGQTELIFEEFDGKFKEISDKIVLQYENEAAEKVLVKFDENSLSMTRFASVPILMKFQENGLTSSFYEGLGNLEIFTQAVKFDRNAGQIFVAYQLSQNGLKIGDYQLKIRWTEVN